MSFLTNLEQSTNRSARTENGALSNNSTLDPLLDFFSRAGAMRGREQEAVQLFKKAYSQDKQSAVRCLFYLRDIRGGQGERSVFKAILKEIDNETLLKVAQHIPEYGRWDEVPLSEPVVDMLIKTQLKEDILNMKQGKSISLLAKWLPSSNTSSKATRANARRLMKMLEMKESQYRKMLSQLRKHIGLLEQDMSSNNWTNIEYDKIPSQAHRKHVKAFKRHNEEAYNSYLESVKKGEKKINASTLFTYEVFDMLRGWNIDDSKIDTADAMWNALPDYTKGKNALVLADVSGSMSGRPMSISVSLALYFAERNDGPFKDYFMTFSARPQLVKVQGSNIKEKLDFIESSHWEMNTNIEAAFDAILDAAKKSDAKGDDMPEVLYIISDMEFDSSRGYYGGVSGNELTNFESAQKKFEDAGFKLPHVVFWNVDSRNDQSPATKYDNRVTLISGSSQSTFQYAVAGKTPLESMIEIINSERYSKIIV